MRLPGHADVPTHLIGESIESYRERLEFYELERRARRERELVEIASAANSPSARIRSWERLYQLSLPRKSGHQMLVKIAANTGLTLAEVEEEQRARAKWRADAHVPAVSPLEAG